MTTTEHTAHTVADRPHHHADRPHHHADRPHHHADRREHHVEPDGPRKSWAVLAVALVAQILVVLDISVVNTALPSIGRSLNLRSGDLQWLVTAYLMMSGGGLLLGGRIADLLSRRRVFLTGLTLFTSASMLSGFAGNAAELIAARAGQGLAAALMTPAALSLIMTTYSGAQRRKGLALWGAVGSMGVAAGVLVGGALTTWAGWQTIFWVNGPIGAVALMAAVKAVPNARTAPVGLRQFDLPGAVTVLAGLMTLMYALGGTATGGWLSARTLLGLSVSAVLLTAFVLIERRTVRPLIPPHTWQVRSLVSGTVVMLGITGILVGAVFLTSIYLQNVLGFSALRAGMAFLPFAFAITAGAQLARHLLGHTAPRTLAVTGLTITAGAALLLSTATGTAHYASDLLPGLVLLGLGVGMVFVPVSVTAMAGIPPQHAGMASGFLMTGHEVGAAFGVAVLSAVATTAGSLTSPAGIVAGFSRGFSRGFTAAAVIAGLIAVVAVLRMSAAPVAAGAGGMHGH
jgi:EmrB/QacA subfamily drug resistance transporter